MIKFRTDLVIKGLSNNNNLPGVHLNHYNREGIVRYGIPCTLITMALLAKNRRALGTCFSDENKK